MKKKNSWEVAGFVPVDSGTLLISDPCYAVRNVAGKEVTDKQWSTFCERLWSLETSGRIKPGAAMDLGYVATGFGGDGYYPIEIKKSKNGLIKELRVRFDSNPLHHISK